MKIQREGHKVTVRKEKEKERQRERVENIGNKYHLVLGWNV